MNDSTKQIKQQKGPFEDMEKKERMALLDHLNALAPEELLRWAAENHGPKAGIVTSFQDTGCAMINMAQAQKLPLRVLTIDTLRLHPETYDLIERIEKHYDLKVERFEPDPERLNSMIGQHGEFLFFDSKPKQEYCCLIRKVEPNRRALASIDIWFTGLRRDQSAARNNIPKASFSNSDGHEVLKLAPLLDWTTEHVRAYLQDNSVPYNALYEKGFTSIGCTVCSTPTLHWEEKRAGRWRWQQEDHDSKECGMHNDGSGI